LQPPDSAQKTLSELQSNVVKANQLWFMIARNGLSEPDHGGTMNNHHTRCALSAKKQRSFRWLIPFLFLAGCAGMDRSCASCNAQNFGADWVVVKMDMQGHPYRCWQLRKVSIANEPHSDGIYWKSPDGHLVHISGHYNRVQVEKENWKSAFAELGLTEQACKTIAARKFDPESNAYAVPSR
jgi:hypothetical protein